MKRNLGRIAIVPTSIFMGMKKVSVGSEQAFYPNSQANQWGQKDPLMEMHLQNHQPHYLASQNKESAFPTIKLYLNPNREKEKFAMVKKLMKLAIVGLPFLMVNATAASAFTPGPDMDPINPITSEYRGIDHPYPITPTIPQPPIELAAGSCTTSVSCTGGSNGGVSCTASISCTFKLAERKEEIA